MSNSKVLVVWNTAKQSQSRFEPANPQLIIEHIDFANLSGVSPGDYDGIVLSGTDISPAANYDAYLGEVDFVMRSKCPVLAICGGFQILMRASGVPIEAAPNPVYGRVQVDLEQPHEWMGGLPNRFTAFAKHRWQVSAVPAQYRALARSVDLLAVYAVAHVNRPIVGVQFHPERGSDGTRLLSNFYEQIATAGGTSGS